MQNNDSLRLSDCLKGRLINSSVSEELIWQMANCGSKHDYFSSYVFIYYFTQEDFITFQLVEE